MTFMEQTPLTTALQRIGAGEFNVPYPERRMVPMKSMPLSEKQKTMEALDEYRRLDGEARENCRKMLAELYGVADHPKEPKLWSLAWEEGHSCGYSEVALKYDEFVDLMK